jgi:tyrosyl-tRNA synthetase
MEKNIEQQIDEILSRGVSEVIEREHLKKRLLSGEKLRVKLGIDPTSPNLHLGRATVLLKMKDLQQLGHQVVLIIGDFTGVIGDTSDKESERPMLDAATVKKNLATYKEQAGKILDMEKVEFHFNSEWLAKLGYAEIGEHADQFSLHEFSARENIKKRLDEGKRVSLRELLYPLMQGYDSVAVRADLELGGTDQRFNLLSGRELQKHFKQPQQDVLMVNLIEGTDGRKMSSSWGNTVNLTDQPNDMFGKIMRVPDELIIKYFIHCTRLPLAEIKDKESRMNLGKSFWSKLLTAVGAKKQELSPRDAKLSLADEIVKLYHGEDAARAAREYFINTFSKKEIPQDIAQFEVQSVSMKLTELVVASGNATSLGDARRKIEQGGVSINDKKITDPQAMVAKENDGQVLKIGKMGFVKIVFKK